jgi:hypothetical protein
MRKTSAFAVCLLLLVGTIFGQMTSTKYESSCRVEYFPVADLDGVSHNWNSVQDDS